MNNRHQTPLYSKIISCYVWILYLYIVPKVFHFIGLLPRPIRFPLLYCVLTSLPSVYILLGLIGIFCSRLQQSILIYRILIQVPIPSLRYTLQQPSTEPAPSVPTCTSFTDMSADQPEAPLTSRLVALVQLQGSITNSYKNWPL